MLAPLVLGQSACRQGLLSLVVASLSCSARIAVSPFWVFVTVLLRVCGAGCHLRCMGASQAQSTDARNFQSEAGCAMSEARHPDCMV